jgi:hydroxyacyl-ACP dehydratase HTD2-like protein with hotdog domain
MFRRWLSTRNVLLQPCSKRQSSGVRWLTCSARLEDGAASQGGSVHDEETTAFLQQLDAMKARKVQVPFGPWNVHNIDAMRRALKSHLALQDYDDQMFTVRPGYHQVCFNPMLQEGYLSGDGADKVHEPNEDWKFRVWAGASIEFAKPLIHHTSFRGGLRQPRDVSVEEKISDARLVGNFHDQSAKVMVTVTRSLRCARHDADGRSLKSKVGGFWHPLAGAWLIKEQKHLCFMRSIPGSLQSTGSPRIVKPPGDSNYSQTMTPTPILLFRFSALTLNAHLIHLDNHYTNNVYGMPKNLVHGPLTSLLMLEVLNEALREAAGGQRPLLVSSFSYKNMLPLFVGEEIRICCKKDHELEPSINERYKPVGGRSWEQWTVWIQKDTENGPTMAVRGTAVLLPPDEKSPEQRQSAKEVQPVVQPESEGGSDAHGP